MNLKNGFYIKYRYRKCRLDNGWDKNYLVYVSYCDFGITSCHNKDDYLKVFKTEEDCHKFMKDWDGHPWFHARRHNGQYKVYQITTKICECCGGKGKVVEDGELEHRPVGGRL